MSAVFEPWMIGHVVKVTVTEGERSATPGRKSEAVGVLTEYGMYESGPKDLPVTTTYYSFGASEEDARSLAAQGYRTLEVDALGAAPLPMPRGH